jgi:hypothetical protein
VKLALHDIPWLLIITFSHTSEFEGMEVRVFDDKEIAVEVFSKTVEALRLIAAVDPNRYRRIHKHVVRMLFTSTPGGHYLPRLRTCRLGSDYARRSATVDLAMMIVHEATHARLWDLGYRYNESARERIERICVNAEVAFASRIPGAENSVARAKKYLDNPWWTTEQHVRRSADELRALGCPSWVLRLLGIPREHEPRDDAL